MKTNLYNAPVVQEDGCTRANVNLVTVVTVHWKTIHGADKTTTTYLLNNNNVMNCCAMYVTFK